MPIKAGQGSEEAFTQYVRGPLREELMDNHSMLPAPYILMILDRLQHDVRINFLVKPFIFAARSISLVFLLLYKEF